MFAWKRPKINEKEAGDGPFLKKLITPLDDILVKIIQIELMPITILRRICPTSDEKCNN